MIALGTWPERPSARLKNTSAVPQQHVDDLAVLVDGPVQVPLVIATKEEHLVGVSIATERSAVLASFVCQLRPERLNPVARCGWTHRCRARPAAPSRSWRTVDGAGTSAQPSGSRRLASGSPKRPSSDRSVKSRPQSLQVKRWRSWRTWPSRVTTLCSSAGNSAAHQTLPAPDNSQTPVEGSTIEAIDLQPAQQPRDVLVSGRERMSRRR